MNDKLEIKMQKTSMMEKCREIKNCRVKFVSTTFGSLLICKKVFVLNANGIENSILIQFSGDFFYYLQEEEQE